MMNAFEPFRMWTRARLASLEATVNAEKAKSLDPFQQLDLTRLYQCEGAIRELNALLDLIRDLEVNEALINKALGVTT